jgi:hypothetical protein
MTYTHSDGSWTALCHIEGEPDILAMVNRRADGQYIRLSTGEEIPPEIRVMTMNEALFHPRPLFPPRDETPVGETPQD